MKDLEDRLKQLPDFPGVYIMKDKNDNIIYVGKAKSLRKRVRQYFGSYGNSSAKVKAMVSNIDDFEYIIVENEVESLILESNLIKDNNPKYNILLRDDKQYPYIKVTINEKYPRVMKTRRISKDKAKYFGPYPNVTAVNSSIEVFHRMFPLKTCSLNLENGQKRHRPCLNFYMGKCLAPCVENVEVDVYLNMIDKITKFLSGRDDSLIKVLKEKMLNASENLEYEKAAAIRDDIENLELLNEKQIISNTDYSDNKDVIGIARGVNEVLVQVFFIRAGKIIGREHYFMRDYFNDSASEIISAFIKQFYTDMTFIPKEVIIEANLEELGDLEDFLSAKRGAGVKIITPQKGEKKELVRLVKKNAIDMLNKYSNKYKKKMESNLLALEEIKDTLNLDKIPTRIEAYDISNTYGVESVGSMIVFESGEAKKTDYRKFKIKDVIGPDDYASMREVLSRRFKRGIEEREKNINSSFASFPDLIMIDGGKGQVNIALEVLENLKLDIEVCGLVKDDFHKTRGIIYNNIEYDLNQSSKGYKLIYKIQEEAHRFAINYHKSLRNKILFKSELDGIEQIGNKRKQDLMKHFKSINKIKNATVEELLEVSSMNKKSAEILYNHFQGGKNEGN
ncbi:Excinuclease ABC subunit C [Anaerosphaera aminiphila DSM 21120]|uniref:UvrABC system protein C n=1 Tax=Anaerosphaera aminiphila DSM 21120 TaxID=1120995 RepID=A0A1M5NVQ2_9FIRM|nr:excinuclease ABC subunit UvrC [Anaerosphaera aminiphila]SHG93063.1 Excinuclease ABC subunit C [Anaerosphaera aminiphila DSM 21120]